MKKMYFIFIVIIYNCNAQEYPVINDLNSYSILKVIYNNYDEKSNSSKWLVNEDSIIKKFYKKEKFYLYTSVVSIIDTVINFNGKRYAVVITQSKPENYDCHPCGPMVGIILLKKNKDNWLIKYNKYVDLIGTWGEIPTPKIELIGKHKYGVSFETGITGQGYTNTKYILYEIQEDKISRLLVVDNFSENNEGICDKSINNCWGYSSTYYFNKSSNFYYELIINTSGTRLEKNNIKKFKETQIYRYINGKYIKIN